MARIISVRQRAIRAVKTAFEGITKANGYDVTVKHVRIPATLDPNSMRMTDPPEIFLVPGIETATMRHIAGMWVCMPMKAYLFLRYRTDDPDGEMDVFASQVKRRIILGMRDSGFVDSLGTTDRTVKVLNQAGYTYRRYMDVGSEAGFLVGAIEFEIEYSHLIDDDRLWDSSDTHVEES